MTNIRPLQPEDCQFIASLHLQNLRTNFSGRPGLELLRLYYQSLVGAKGGCGFVAEQEGRILGYVCGIWDPVNIHSFFIRKYGVGAVIWGIDQIIVSPKILRSIKSRFLPMSNQAQDLKLDYELRPIVVSSEARGTGISVRLVEALVADATERGFLRIQLFTESDNIAAQKFYHKAGFCKVGTISRDGISYLQFAKELFYTR